MTLRQRQPRIEDPAYLAFVRLQPCLICGRGPSDAAHIRAAAPHYGKRPTGFGEKPSDCWAVPLCRRHHEAQHRESELGWWAGIGIPDPFAVAVALYASRPNQAPRVERRKAKVFTRKPKSQRTHILQRSAFAPGRRLESRSSWQVGRKLSTRRPEQSP